MNEGNDQPSEPNILEQTLELATILKKISERDPEGHPTETASKVFREWLLAAQSSTEEPQYFQDVYENYDVLGRSNKDLFDLFELLHPYVDIVDDREFPEDDEFPTSGRTFISLPTL